MGSFLETYNEPPFVSLKCSVSARTCNVVYLSKRENSFITILFSRLNNTQNEVASEDMPVSLFDAEKMLKEHEDLKEEIDSREPDFRQLMASGPKWIQDECDLQQQSLKEQLDNLETGWNDVHILWENRKKMLIQALNHQVWR